MNQPETMTPSVAAPLHQLKGHLINKGYSYSEVKEDGAVIVIFKASADDLQNDLICMPPITNNQTLLSFVGMTGGKASAAHLWAAVKRGISTKGIDNQG